MKTEELTDVAACEIYAIDKWLLMQRTELLLLQLHLWFQKSFAWLQGH